MNSSKFSITAFIISLLVFIQALIAFIDFPETHPLAAILFPLVLLIYLPDYPLGYLPQRLGFPIVLPLLTIVFAIISLRKGENKKILSIISLVLVFVSILLYTTFRFLPAKERGPLNIPQTTPSATMANWQVYRNSELRYEFKYPPNHLEPSRGEGDTSFVVGYPIKEEFRSDPLVAKSADKTFWVSLGYISQTQLNVMGVTYCGAYPQDTPRCESREIDGARSTIDWGIVIPFTRITADGKEVQDSQFRASAWIPHPEGGVVTFELQPVVPESKEKFYQILSTFRFLK